ncbi:MULTISPECIES: universal stress protein [Haloarcula]|uniref:universal stress protein n=1 Tax=Haloarcula TaxID=2237 RepID=UPI0023ECFFFA|nr:universal stress protein [Halomicroarcula sp. XH51]
MYDQVLLPTDGSEGAAAATDVAFALAGRFDAPVHALYVVDERFVADEFDAPVEAAEREATAALEAASDRGTEHGVSVEKHLRRGVPHEEILDAVDDYAADLVVMGTHGRTGLDRFRHVGSVTERVVRSAPVEVHTVPAGRADA